MKKLIAIAVVFALAAGMGFAADIGANVIGTVNLFGSNTNTGTKVNGSAMFDRLRIEGSGEAGDGAFGAWIRFEGMNTTIAQGDVSGKSWEEDQIRLPVLFGLAWWKPIDQVKVTIGGNPDGIFGKEGYAGWMWQQIAADTGVVNPGNAWGGSYMDGDPAVFRNAFYGGFAGNGLLLEIKPVDMFGLNIVLPYWGEADEPWGGVKAPYSEVAGVFKNMTIQADVNLDFGNIALTYDMGTFDYGNGTEKVGGKMYLYFNLSAIDNLSLDFGIGFPMPQSYYGGSKAMDPLAIALAAKFNVNDSFGIKARVLAEFMGSTTTAGGYKDTEPFHLLFDLQPFFALNDSIKIAADIGIGMIGKDKETVNSKSTFGWHFNPYVQIGGEWGPSFFAGIMLYADGSKKGNTDSALINWSVPIALNVSF